MRVTAVGGGRFEVRGLAGEGGMSLVYRGVDRQDGSAVAIKILADGVSVGERFARESHLLADVDDPCIVRYVAHGLSESGQHYLVTEWLEGEPLSRRLQAGSLGLEETLRLGVRVSEALGRLHQRGIVHRDIKPSNLFLRGGVIERVTIIDFGIARRADAASELTRTGIAVGTPGYMAPEQARGERDIDARADVFALGCVLFRCMTGRTPFRGDHALAIQLKIMLEETPSMRELRPGVPRALDELVRRMLAKSRDGRPPHGQAVARELIRVPLGDSPDRGGDGQAGLTAAEQQLLSVVVMGGRSEAVTLAGGRDDSADDLAVVAERFGAQFDSLADGVTVCTIRGGAASDQAMRAARCALAVGAERPDAIIAVATGTGMVSDGLPFGDAIDRAVALLRPSGDPGIRLDPVTGGLLPPQFQTSSGPSAILLVREREQSEPIRTLLGRPTPLVGRRKELRILEAILDECVGERVARAAMLVGPAGIGKSRVRYEFMRDLERRADRLQLWLGRGDSLLAASPFGLVAQALRRQCGAGRQDPAAALRDRVARSLPADRVDEVTAFLGEMIGSPLSDEARPPLRSARESAHLMNERISESWSELLAAECADRPLVLIVEDAHWADPSSLRLVEDALRALDDRAFFVLAVARPEIDDAFPNLWQGRDLQRVVLAPLTGAASAELVRDALGAELAAEVVDRICERSAGNAFFLEELIRAEAEGAPSPGTVLAVVQARLEGLAPDSRRVLRAASVFGQAFWRGGVDSLMGDGDPIDLDLELAALAAAEVITRTSETRIPGQVQYAFRHVLVSEAAYATLTDEDRMRGHRLAGDWLERVGGAEADVAVLAEHHEKGGALQRAAPWWVAAGERALSGADPDAALAFADKAKACGASGSLRGEVELIRALAFDWRAEFEPGLRATKVALAALPPGQRRWCRAVALRARLLLHRGENDSMRALARDLQARLEAGPIGIDQVSAAVVVVYLLRMAGARGEDDQLLAVVESRSPPEVLADARVRAYLALCRTVLIQTNLASDLIARREAAALFEQAGDFNRAAGERFNGYFDLFQLGAYHEARRGFEATLVWAERRKLHSLQRNTRALLGETLVRIGEIAEGVAMMEKILAVHREAGSARNVGALLRALAEAHLASGDLDRALACARESSEVLGASARPLVPMALAVLALVELELGRPAEAVAHAAEAMREAGALESLESSEMIVRLAYIEATWAAGDHVGAREAARVARQRLDEIADEIADDELRAAFLAVDENARVLARATEWLV